MASRRSSRVFALTLALALIALPAVAGEPAGQSKGFFERLARTVVRLALAVAGLPAEQGVPATSEDPDEPRPEDDLGPGLDPLGRS
jgi:hypothetical protein